MDTTITLGDAGTLLLGLALLVLLVYCIILVKNLIPSVKSISKILKDTETISGVAAESSLEAQKIVSDLSSSLGSVSEIIKGNQSIVAALTSIINALTSLKNLFKK